MRCFTGHCRAIFYHGGFVALCVCIFVIFLNGSTTKLSAQQTPTAPSPRSDPRADLLPDAPTVVRTKNRVFSIPFRLPPKKSTDASPRSVMLSVSKDLGATWETAQEVASNVGSFTYRAEHDGEYWFRLRAVDADGRMRGGHAADMRVMVDAAGPRVILHAWKGTDGEVICRYAAADDSLRLDTLRLEYRTKQSEAWKPVAAEGILARESPAHLIGEEIWWAGEQTEGLIVRISVADNGGNRTVKQTPLGTSDPQIDQSMMARDLGVPELPTQSSGFEKGPTLADAPAQSTPVSQAWQTETGRLSTAGSSSPIAATRIMASRVGSSELARLSEQSTSSASTEEEPHFPDSSSLATQPGAAAVEIPADQKPADSFETAALVYRGRPLDLVRSRRFEWDYEFNNDRPAIGPLRVELWSTRDGGVTWQKTAVDDDTASPISVEVPESGLYGFRLEIVPDRDDLPSGPRSGETPEAWVGVDDAPPEVILVNAQPTTSGESGGILITWSSKDPLLVPRSARLLFSPRSDGPWATIVESQETQGEYRWQPDRSVPATVFMRVEVSDAAGNIGHAVTEKEIVVTASRVVGKLRAVKSIAPAANAGP